jgi:hypothetical protein
MLSVAARLWGSRHGDFSEGEQTMRVKILVLAAAATLAGGIGSVSAADQLTTLNWVHKLTTLNGVNAVPMTSSELGVIKGRDLEYFRVLPPGDGNYPQDAKGRVNPDTPPQAAPLDNGSRIETNHYQAENGEGNFVTIEVIVDGVPTSFTISPSWLGLRNAGCNGVIVFPYPGSNDAQFC